MRVLDQVREIIEHEWLWLVFQPVASMRGDTNERYEALLRLRDRQGQDLVPGSVFGVVYNHELGLTLDRWVIDACAGNAEATTAGHQLVYQGAAGDVAG
jgi:EAL domain-containing protein (putative c-di-GMP-specific phosphodiesterase class I)